MVNFPILSLKTPRYSHMGTPPIPYAPLTKGLLHWEVPLRLPDSPSLIHPSVPSQSLSPVSCSRSETPAYLTPWKLIDVQPVTPTHTSLPFRSPHTSAPSKTSGTNLNKTHPTLLNISPSHTFPGSCSSPDGKLIQQDPSTHCLPDPS